MKNYHNHIRIGLLSILILMIISPSSFAKKYTWETYTQPFRKPTHLIALGQSVDIFVSLPEFIRNYEEIPLYITAVQEDPVNPSRKFLIINDGSQWDAYPLPIFGEEEVTIQINVKTGQLKAGLNKLRFMDDAHSSQYGLIIKQLRFDLTGKADINQYRADSQKNDTAAKDQSPESGPLIPKTIVSEKQNPASKSKIKNDTSPPEIILTSHDTNRGMQVVQNQKVVTIKGRAQDSSGIVEVIIDNKEANLDKDGNFKADTFLKVGENKITITAMDRYGNKSTKTITIIRKNPDISQAKQVPKSSSGKYYALVIGNNDYQYIAKLQTAKKDAQQVAAALADRYGFETDLLLNASREEILRAINEYRKRLTENDSFLIYYAGHGEFDKTTNKAYWLPVDAKSDDDTDWIIVDTITSNIKRISSKHILIVSDSCYSGTLTRGTVAKLDSGQARDRYLERMKTKRSRTLLASGGNEPVSDSGGQGHSVFAAALLDGLQDMEKGIFTAEELFYVHIKERVAGNADQVPEYNIIRNSGHDGGDFIFRKTE